MPIVGGLDIHRKQLTFDYLDTESGEVKRGQIAPADRAHLQAWLARFAGRDDVAFALEGCTGWRYVAAGKRHAKTDSRHLRELLAEGRLPECWVPPSRILECRALLETYHDLRAEHTGWVQRIHAVFFHQGAPALGEGALRTDRDLAGAAGGRRRAPVSGRAAAGGYRLGHAGRAGGPPGRAAAPAAGCCPEPDRRQGARRAAVRGRPGHRAGDDLLAGRRGGPVRRLDVTVWSSDRKGPPGRLSRQGPEVLRFSSALTVSGRIGVAFHRRSRRAGGAVVVPPLRLLSDAGAGHGRPRRAIRWRSATRTRRHAAGRTGGGPAAWRPAAGRVRSGGRRARRGRRCSR